MPVAFNPLDKLQQVFLSALALGETGGNAKSATEGVGGSDLSGAPTDAYGFPQWGGVGNSHAAGTFQFQPGTWDSIANEYHLNFANPNDQAYGAWELAQQSDPTLYDDLRNGNFSKIQSALANVWPSVTGNGAAPQGLANDLAAGLNSDPSSSGLSGWQQAVHDFLVNNTGATSTSGDANPVTPLTSAGSSAVSAVGGGIFTQGALIAVGAVIILVALWMLLSSGAAGKAASSI